MRFLIFIYGKSRMKRTQLVSDKRAECHILLPKDDFSLERTVFLQFKNISGEWFIKETDCCHLKTEEFFQMGKRKSDEGIFYKLSIGRKNELSVGGKDLYIQLIRYRNDWSIYKKYKLRDCRIIKEKNIFIMMEKAINRKNSMGISYEYGKWFIEKCGNIEIYINEILLEKKQQLEFGDVICIGTIYLLFFENYIAVEAGERNIVSDYLEEVVLENEIKGQEDVRKKEKREITFHRAPRVMEELKKVAKKNSNAKLQIAVMEFNTNVKWMQPDGLEEAEDFYWVDLQAGGLTEVGAALKELDSKLSRETFLKGIMGNLMPVIIIMTDGGATSDYKKELDEIKKNRWFQNASKIGFAVGEYADLDMIADVVGNSEAVIKTDDMKTFAKLIRLASVTASKIGSVSRTSAGGSITEEIVKTVKGESEHQPLPEEPPFPDPVPEDIPPFLDPVSEDDPWDETEFD